MENFGNYFVRVLFLLQLGDAQRTHVRTDHFMWDSKNKPAPRSNTNVPFACHCSVLLGLS